MLRVRGRSGRECLLGSMVVSITPLLVSDNDALIPQNPSEATQVACEPFIQRPLAIGYFAGLRRSESVLRGGFVEWGWLPTYRRVASVTQKSDDLHYRFLAKSSIM